MELIDFGGIVTLKITDFDVDGHKIVFRPTVDRKVRLSQKPNTRKSFIELIRGLFDDIQIAILEGFGDFRLDALVIGQKRLVTLTVF